MLSQTGNWKRDKLDLNGDGDYLDTASSGATVSPRRAIQHGNQYSQQTKGKLLPLS